MTRDHTSMDDGLDWLVDGGRLVVNPVTRANTRVDDEQAEDAARAIGESRKGRAEDSAP
jgi:hypothetical protein